MKRFSHFVTLFFILYLFWNWSALIGACERGGDYSLILLETERASKFEAQLGPYSRFHFHHPGPFLFYLYAIGDFLFGWFATPTGALYLTQLLVNGVLLYFAFGSVKKNEASKLFAPILFSLFLLVSVEARGGVLRDIWNPSVAYVSTFSFVLLSGGIFAGNLSFIIPWIFAFVISFSHHLGSIPVIILIGTISLCNGLIRRDKKRLSITSLLFCAAIVGVAFVPPFIEVFQNQNFGNFGEIVRFFLKSKPQHSTQDGIFFLGSYISPLFLGLIKNQTVLASLLAVTLILPLLIEFPKGSSERTLCILTLIGFFVSALSVRSAEGKLYNYLMMYLYGLAAIPFASLVSFASTKINAKAIHLLVAVIPFLLLPLHSLTTRPCRDEIQSAVPVITSNSSRPIRVYTNELHLWGSVATLVSKLYRSGESVCIDKLWDFMFGKDLVCTDSPKYSVEVSSLREIPKGKNGLILRKGSLIFDTSVP